MTSYVHIVVGTNQWPDDGFELIRSFHNKKEAEEYAASDQPAEDGQFGWRRYGVTSVECDL